MKQFTYMYYAWSTLQQRLLRTSPNRLNLIGSSTSSSISGRLAIVMLRVSLFCCLCRGWRAARDSPLTAPCSPDIAVWSINDDDVNDDFRSFLAFPENARSGDIFLTVTLNLSDGVGSRPSAASDVLREARALGRGRLLPCSLRRDVRALRHDIRLSRLDLKAIGPLASRSKLIGLFSELTDSLGLAPRCADVTLRDFLLLCSMIFSKLVKLIVNSLAN